MSEKQPKGLDMNQPKPGDVLHGLDEEIASLRKSGKPDAKSDKGMSPREHTPRILEGLDEEIALSRRRPSRSTRSTPRQK
jgi:hypothetical protein